MIFTFSFFCLFTAFIFIFSCYPRMISVLLGLEVLFFSCFFNFLIWTNGSNSPFFSCFVYLILFLVLDSVLGVTLLVSVSRSSGLYFSWFF